MKKLFLKQTVGISIILSLFLSLFLPYSLSIRPQKNVAHAIPVVVAGNPWEAAWDQAKEQLMGLAKQLATTVVLQLTQDIVNWIDSGFDGNPAFIQDPVGFLETSADIAIGEFIFDNAELRFLCDPFKVEIQLALGLQYQPFRNKINCSLSEILTHTENAYNDFVDGDFISGGGWDSWFEITTIPSNNPQGAFVIAQHELNASVDKHKVDLAREVDWGSGALSYKKCTKSYYLLDADGVEREDPSKATEEFTGSAFYKVPEYAEIDYEDEFSEDVPFSRTECVVTTPGTTISNKLGFADTSDQRMLELKTATATAFDAIAAALSAKLVEYALSTFKDGILGTPDRPDTSAELEEALKRLEDSRVIVADAGKRAIGSTPVTAALTTLKNSAISQIETSKDIEQRYINARSGALSSFVQTKKAFASTTGCLNRAGDTDRAKLTAEVVKIINVGVSTDPGIVALKIDGKIVSIKALEEDIAIAETNISALENKENNINNALTESAINNELNGIDSSPFHLNSDIKAGSYELKTKEWLLWLISTYASPDRLCNIDPNSISF